MKKIFGITVLFLLCFNFSLFAKTKQPIAGPNCHIVHSAKSINSGNTYKNINSKLLKSASVPDAVIAIAEPSAVMIEASAAPAWSQPFWATRYVVKLAGVSSVSMSLSFASTLMATAALPSSAVAKSERASGASFMPSTVTVKV